MVWTQTTEVVADDRAFDGASDRVLDRKIGLRWRHVWMFGSYGVMCNCCVACLHVATRMCRDKRRIVVWRGWRDRTGSFRFIILRTLKASPYHGTTHDPTHDEKHTT